MHVLDRIHARSRGALAAAADDAQPYARRWWALLVLCASLLLVVMANTSLTVAAPSMTDSLGLSSSELQWVVDAYIVVYAGLMLVFGAIGDRLGRRGALLAGLVVFGAAAIFGSQAGSATELIAARALMGVGAALVMPATLSLLGAIFPRRERAVAITLWSATSGLAIALGPLLAGWILESHEWGATFLINVPLAAVTAVAALALVPTSRAPTRGPADVLGGALSIVALSALVYAIIEGANHGWGTSAIIAAVTAAAAGVAFALWELRTANPVLDLRRFRQRAFAFANFAIVVLFLAVFGAFYYVTQHLQFVLGYSALDTGVRLLPVAFSVFLGAALSRALTPRAGLKLTVSAGMGMATVAFFLMATIDDGSGYAFLVAPMILLGTAIGLSLSPATDTIMDSFPDDELGVAGAVNDTSLELGGALGVAILGSTLATAYRSALPADTLAALPAQAHDSVTGSIGGALAAAEQLRATGATQAAELLTAGADHAFSHAVAQASLVGGLILAAGTILTLIFLLNRSSATEQAATPEPAPTTSRTSGEPVTQRAARSRTLPDTSPLNAESGA